MLFIHLYIIIKFSFRNLHFDFLILRYLFSVSNYTLRAVRCGAIRCGAVRCGAIRCALHVERYTLRATCYSPHVARHSLHTTR